LVPFQHTPEHRFHLAAVAASSPTRAQASSRSGRKEWTSQLSQPEAAPTTARCGSGRPTRYARWHTHTPTRGKRKSADGVGCCCSSIAPARTSTHEHTRTSTHAHARTHTQAHTRTRTHARTHTHGRTHARTHTRTQIRTRAAQLPHP
jgi:hypothetical protein